MNGYSAFTYHGNFALSELSTPVQVFPPLVPETFVPKNYTAIWDTGATSSCITQRIVDDLGLQSVGSQRLSTANGFVMSNTYLVAFMLPNNTLVENVLASCADLSPDTDVLIGMDIITLGNFAVSTYENSTWFSFVIPSTGHVDYVEDMKPSK